jgi:hypothetical protein
MTARIRDADDVLVTKARYNVFVVVSGVRGPAPGSAPSKRKGAGDMRGAAIVLVGVLAAVAVLVAGTIPEADSRTRFRVITKTLSNEGKIQIPSSSANEVVAATPYPSNINSGGFRRGRVLDVNLTLKNFSHTYPDDVDVLLAHRGQSRTVMSDVGGNSAHAVSNITLVLDDEAASQLPDSSSLAGGRFKPTNIEGDDLFPAPAQANEVAALKGFDGSNPNRSWSLYVADDTGPVDGGEFAGGWSLRIKAKVRR